MLETSKSRCLKSSPKRVPFSSSTATGFTSLQEPEVVHGRAWVSTSSPVQAPSGCLDGTWGLGYPNSNCGTGPETFLQYPLMLILHEHFCRCMLMKRILSLSLRISGCVELCLLQGCQGVYIVVCWSKTESVFCLGANCISDSLF